ncbi:hypothetical protein GGS23DRAFT_110969 [Durotheca rogersii]|uniref:uncharacterized protein n=1 Tax=Durotheca rogersii TaxID=419775 RepID=UPI0022202C46|nr:uncharacterized protein GGS23DRAFT_110969 [Durotheca rogersii]KAI5862199.1 hypothetical protein GGS23DRAFT_110969 [Durotheca rogersii]
MGPFHSSCDGLSVELVLPLTAPTRRHATNYRSGKGRRQHCMCIIINVGPHASAKLYNLSPNFKNIDPCTNFGEMVYGGFRERNVIPQYEISLESNRVIDEPNSILMKDILESRTIRPGSNRS